MTDDNYPIRQMLLAAKRAKSNENAVWAALSVLEKTGGYIILPMAGGRGWRPSIAYLKRRKWKSLAATGND